MRILYFNYLYDIHGASLGSAIKPIELFANMEKLGHKVSMHWFKGEQSSAEDNQARFGLRKIAKQYLAPIAHDPKLFFENFIFMSTESQMIKTFSPDLIVTRLDYYLFSAIRNAMRYDIPIIVEADSPPVYEAVTFQPQYWRISRLVHKIENWVLQQADFVIMQSVILQEYFQKKAGLNRKKTAVISNGADIHKFSLHQPSTDIIHKLQLENKIVLGFIGSMNVWHGMDNFIELIKNIKNKHSNIIFLLVGSGGGYERKLQEIPDLSKYVVITGYIPHTEIPKYLSVMDIVLAPYPDLPFFYYSPVKIYEYMAAGKAIVTTGIGQISEIIQNDKNGLVCPPNDVVAFTTAVEHLINNPDKRKTLGKNARKCIAEKHTWMHKAREWEKICSQVIASYKKRQGAG